MGIQIPREKAILRGEGAAHCKVYEHSAVSCAKTSKPIKMPFGLTISVGPRKHALDGSRNYHIEGSIFM